MKNEFLLKEKESLLQWLDKIIENNSEEIENYQMLEYIKKQIKNIDNKLIDN